MNHKEIQVWSLGTRRKYNKYGELPCSQTYMIEKKICPLHRLAGPEEHLGLLRAALALLGGKRPGAGGHWKTSSTQGNETTSDCFFSGLF